MGVDNRQRILVVDDDGDILDLLKYNLEKEGFKVKTLEKSHKTISVATKFSPDLIILDLMMPRVNGLEICTQLRCIQRFAHTYIFFLTARSGNQHQQAALSFGGDDYIEKVMGLRSLIYKINSVLKSSFTIRKGIAEIRIGQLKLDRNHHTVIFHGKEVKLNTPEFELLFFFAQNPHKVISLENIIKNIWGSEIYLFDTSVELYIENLKKKIYPGIIRSPQHHQYKFSGD
jgi:two-component system, OmpR family, alkaline phosphatase synthesis response regulator PhoP